MHLKGNNTVKLSNQLALKTTKHTTTERTTKTPAKDKYANPKNKMEVQAHNNNEYLVQQQETEYRIISKDKTHNKIGNDK